jgi:hypothetical protein
MSRILFQLSNLFRFRIFQAARVRPRAAAGSQDEERRRYPASITDRGRRLSWGSRRRSSNRSAAGPLQSSFVELPSRIFDPDATCHGSSDSFAR